MRMSSQSSAPLSWRTLISLSARNGPSEVGVGHGFAKFLLQRDGADRPIDAPVDLREGEFEEGLQEPVVGFPSRDCFDREHRPFPRLSVGLGRIFQGIVWAP